MPVQKRILTIEAQGRTQRRLFVCREMPASLQVSIDEKIFLSVRSVSGEPAFERRAFSPKTPTKSKCRARNSTHIEQQ